MPTAPRKRLLRIPVGVALGIAVLFGFMLMQVAIEGIHPLDWWHSVRVHAIVGCGIGLIVGVVWACQP